MCLLYSVLDKQYLLRNDEYPTFHFWSHLSPETRWHILSIASKMQ